MKKETETNAIAHNQYSVSEPSRHYMWGQAEEEETLLDRVIGYTAFALFMLVCAFWV
jgi:hypothetical protein